MITLVAAPPVGDKYAVGREGIAAVLEEGLFHQSIDNLFAVKTIYQNHIGIVAEHFNIFRAICLDNFKIFAFVRQFKQAARHGDDLRIDVNGGLLGIGQVAVYPTGKRAAAQADLGDVFGRGFCKQQPTHHGAAVRQHQLGRMIDIHGALNGVAAQVQGTDIAFFGNADFGQMGFGWAQAAVRMAGWHVCRRKM